MGFEELDRMSPKTREKYLEIIRAISPGRKIEITVDFCDSVRQMVLDVIRSENPEASETEVRRMFARRVLPPEICDKVYGKGAN
ncbi:MAG: hypothetical protein ACYC64_13175 [Armatimonadota bacterium]